MIAAIGSKVWGWVLALVALMLTVAAIFYKGKSSGEAKQQTKVDEANQRADVAQQQQQITESRHDTDTKVQNLPQAPAQTVADADPATAAGHLRDDGWMR